MQLSHFLFATTSFMALVSANPIPAPKADIAQFAPVVKRQAAAIKTALEATEAEAITLRDIFAAATGEPAEIDAIRAQNVKLLQSGKSP